MVSPKTEQRYYITGMAVQNRPEYSVSIGLRKNGLVIVVENSFDGIIKKNIHGNIISIKENKEHHGYGLKSIRKTVEKYDGELVVEIRGNIFRAVAFMTCIDYV